MAVQVLDAKGLKSPKPVLKLAAKAPTIPAGDVVELIGDCPTLEKDVKQWCDRMKKTIIEIIDEGNNVKRIKIQF